MRWSLLLALALIYGALVHALPVKEKKEEHKKEEEEKKEAEEQGEDWELNLEYGRYLKEVVQALESDPSFRKKLETAEVDDIKSGKIARELHFVDHNVRTKLDELKRRELERLRHLAIKMKSREHEKETGVDRNMLKIPVHIDHRNPTRFEVEDLKKLIIKTTADLEKVDQQRREEFKKYEMEKEFERKQELAGMDDEHRKQAEEKHNEEIKKHGEHEKLHHPASKQQLEEVWEEQDHMSKEEFKPEIFFHLHDLDGNGYWDEMEVKALFKKELDKMYDPNAPEDDINERYEEMERMREHVFKESDINRDNLISFEEFLEQTKKSEFEQDGGWQGLDEQEVFSQQEYEEFERRRQEEIRQLVESGVIPPPPGYHGMPPPQPAMYQGGPHPGLHPAAQGILPPQAVPQYGVPPQVHPNAVPPQVHANAVPHGYQAVPQGYQAVPQGYQAVPQGYQAVPQGQVPPQQVQYIPHGAPYQAPAQPQAQQPVLSQPQVQQPVQGQPQVQQPIQGQAQVPAQQPIQGQPQVQQPMQGQPQAQQQIQGQPQVQQPIQGQPQVQQPIQGQLQAQQPVQGQPPAQQPLQGQHQEQQPIQVQAQGQQPLQGQQPQPVAGQPPNHQPIQPVAAHPAAGR
ncbi:nucleobindin-2-like [Penaeus vannamei]|uniref:nucleobindin-2-like n=1 Tax=Penaeus vannamei TaxID=6689 RepID=UPI000F65D1C0|nr:nucleobindin-2-like isoform X1 [Penaeus vannamei]XP_027221068.1 nucleobindin-2-like isoform X1 [Penaeus vannamei]